MPPDDTRLRILAEHERLRDVLAELDVVNKRFEDERESGVGAELRELGAGLFEIFAAHLTLEDSLLAPALESLGGNGPDLADRLKREHCEQREMLRYLMRRLEEEGRPTQLISNELRSFSEYLLRDMQHEEETMLREDLLSSS